MLLHKNMSETEIAQLSEEEKSLYQKLQEEYRQRAAFVDRLEQLDTVEMPEAKPKRVALKRIKPVEIKTGSVSEKRTASYSDKLKGLLSAANKKHSISVNIEKNKPVSLPEVCKVENNHINWKGKAFEICKASVPNVNQPEVLFEAEQGRKINPLPMVKSCLPKKVEFLSPEPAELSASKVNTAIKPKKVSFSCGAYKIKATDMPNNKAVSVKYEMPEIKTEKHSCKSIAAPEIKMSLKSDSKCEISVPHAVTAHVPEVKAEVCKTKAENVKKVYISCPEVKCSDVSYKADLPEVKINSPKTSAFSESKPFVISKTDVKPIAPSVVSYNKPEKRVVVSEKISVNTPTDSKEKCNEALNRIMGSLKG